MPLQIEETASGTVAVYKLTGRLTAGLEVNSLESALQKTLGDGIARIAVDMREIYYVDSAGLGALIGGLTAARKASGEVRLFGVDERVLKIMKLTHLHTVIPMDATREDACRNLEA